MTTIEIVVVHRVWIRSGGPVEGRGGEVVVPVVGCVVVHVRIPSELGNWGQLPVPVGVPVFIIVVI